MKHEVLGFAVLALAASVGSSCSSGGDGSQSSEAADGTVVVSAPVAGTDTTATIMPEPSTDNGATAPPVEDAGCASSTGVNLLNNPSFEGYAGLAAGWEDESTTMSDPTYTISNDQGIVQGRHSQRMQYTGSDGDDGTKKAQFYQAPVNGVAAGQTVQFSLCVSGPSATALTKAYAIIGVEAFDPTSAYISDVSTNIITVDATPTRYSIDYTVPDGAGYVAVFVQAPEFSASSAIDLYFDQASLVIV